MQCRSMKFHFGITLTEKKKIVGDMFFLNGAPSRDFYSNSKPEEYFYYITKASRLYSMPKLKLQS